MRSKRGPSFFPFLALTCLMTLASSGETIAQQHVGTFSFLKLEPSARAAALAGSYSAIYGDDVNSLYYNPALLNTDMDGSLSLSYLNHLSDLNAGFVGYAREFSGIGLIAGGLRFLTWGSIDETDSDGNLTGSFGTSDVALSVGYARAYDERVRYGITMHTIYSSIAEHSASAIAFDAGVVYHVAEQQLTFSAVLRNYGRTLSTLGATSDRLPVDLRISVSKRLEHLPLLLTVTGYELQEPSDVSGETLISNVLRHTTVGGEFQFSPVFHVRFGYDHRVHQEMKMTSRLDLAGMAAGFGLRINRFNLDYAFNSWSSAGSLHHFSVRTKL